MECIAKFIEVKCSHAQRRFFQPLGKLTNVESYVCFPSKLKTDMWLNYRLARRLEKSVDCTTRYLSIPSSFRVLLGRSALVNSVVKRAVGTPTRSPSYFENAQKMQQVVRACNTDAVWEVSSTAFENSSSGVPTRRSQKMARLPLFVRLARRGSRSSSLPSANWHVV